MSDFWENDKAVARLKELIGLGNSAVQIAKLLSTEFGRVSRSGVLGKARRMGLTLGDAARAKEIRTIHVRRIVAASPPPVVKAPAAIPSQAPTQAFTPSNPERAERIDAIATEPKTLLDPAFGGCRWPLYRTAEDGSHLFCCNARPVGRPYCDGHARFATTKTLPAQMKAEEQSLTNANQKANRGSQANNLVFSPRAA